MPKKNDLIQKWEADENLIGLLAPALIRHYKAVAPHLVRATEKLVATNGWTGDQIEAATRNHLSNVVGEPAARKSNIPIHMGIIADYLSGVK